MTQLPLDTLRAIEQDPICPRRSGHCEEAMVMGEADGASRSVGEVYAAAYKAYLKTVQEGLAELDIEAVDVGGSAAGAGPVLNTVAVPIHTHFTSCLHTHFNCLHTHFNCLHTHFNCLHTHPTFATTATIGTESTLATSPAGA